MNTAFLLESELHHGERSHIDYTHPPALVSSGSRVEIDYRLSIPTKITKASSANNFHKELKYGSPAASLMQKVIVLHSQKHEDV